MEAVDKWFRGVGVLLAIVLPWLIDTVFNTFRPAKALLFPSVLVGGVAADLLVRSWWSAFLAGAAYVVWGCVGGGN